MAIISMVLDVIIIEYCRTNRKIRSVEWVERHDISRVKGIIPTVDGRLRKAKWHKLVANCADRKRAADRYK